METWEFVSFGVLALMSGLTSTITVFESVFGQKWGSQSSWTQPTTVHCCEGLKGDDVTISDLDVRVTRGGTGVSMLITSNHLMR